MSASHGASRYIPMSFFDSLADARKTLRENSLLALETQIDLLDWLHGNQSGLAYQNFMRVYGYRTIDDESQRATLGTWLRDRVRSVLSDASTYYVSPDMCEMVRMATEELPSAELSPKDLPTSKGFLFFARPMIIDGPDNDTVEVETGKTEPVAITGLAWEDGQVGHPTQGVQPGASYWLFMNTNDAATITNRQIARQFSEQTGQPIFEPVVVEGDAPPGTLLGELMTEQEVKDGQGPLPIYDFSGWTYGTSWTSVMPGENFVQVIERAEDGGAMALPNVMGASVGAVNEDGSLTVHPVVDQARRLLLATWKMLGEKITVLDEERPPRYIRRRAERRMPETGDIVVVRLRRETHGQLVVENPEEGPWWSHRWMVRGHWHPYWIGPRGSQTKIIKWVAPYIKGPEGAPLVLKEKISSLER